ncbi:ATP-dependent DNA helicase DinG [Thermaerobacillus caldiproteolyticus]|uniref:3'-5' exonuclease DinG n=1 Tax=Thermaerobacillus caldiproteolyticus TaxID=247480 RepID=A0A7W0C0B0_9BACL|nr:ATP-dependent DNA helicase DinG [Anoxybacillus caldiproteolyticus]MBA2875064.1 ATP-dependent DNA helicase DinG [Anoxybacillus caldiproteolyticus]
MNERFVVIDLETTGNTPKKGDRIIQIGMIVIENGQIIERFSSFVNPERDIPPFIQQFTNIDEQMVKHAPVFAEVAPKLVETLQEAYFVAHNVSFDLMFLQEELKMAGLPLFSGPTIDTVELARILFPTSSSYKLNELAQKLQIAHTQPHQADSDAEVTAKLLLALFEQLRALPLVTLQQLQRLSRDLHSDLSSLLEAMVMEKMKSLHDERSYMFYRGIALKKPTTSVSKQQTWANDTMSFSGFLEGSHTLPLADYEQRDGQWEMMKIVHEALETSQHAVIEAGTGIGKSLAYLIPSVFFTYEKQKRVVISTHTLQLQQQLVERDIPLVRKIVPFPFQVAVLKGKRNYLSLNKFISFLHDENKNYDVVLMKCQLLVWLTQTETGDMDELNLSSGGRLFWTSLEMDEESREEKYNFFIRAKQKAKEAHLIITNHAFLLQDVTASTPLIPEYEHIVIDEAHHLEEVASHYFGQQVDYVTVRLLLTRMGKSHEDGSLYKLNQWFKQQGIDADTYFARCDQIITDLEFECDELFRMIRRYALVRKTNEITGRCRYRFQPEKEHGRQWEAIQELLWRVLGHTSQLVEYTNQLYTLFQPFNSQSDHHYFTDVSLFEKLIRSLHHLLEADDPMVVRWIEAEAKGAANATTIYSQPIQLGEFFADQLFAKKKSVVLTSATLTMNNNFTYIMSRLGLEDFYPICRAIPSPFSYEHQAKLMVPSDVPAISAVSIEDYANAVADHILQIADSTNGKMLVLFTSYELLKLTASALKDKNKDETFVLLAQGMQGGSAAKLTKTFQQFDKAVLFGTSNFWEGVDLPKEQLSIVIIVRLPFAPPDDPVIEAKSEQIRASGGNPFYDLSLPQAVIRFKQGFGRLIRTSKDKGVVFVFDRRLTSASYGKYFLASLPPVSVYEEPLESLLQKLKEWL